MPLAHARRKAQSDRGEVVGSGSCSGGRIPGQLWWGSRRLA
jgi:hypothetical protein